MGGLRFILAGMVMLGHLSGKACFLNAAFYSVFAFYMVSGFLMTEVCRERYQLTAEGGKRFLVSRMLRLFPAYYTILLFALLLAFFFQQPLETFHENIRVPQDAKQWLSNLTIIGFLGDRPVRLIPPVWSVAFEMIWYLIIWLLASRSRANALIILSISVMYAAWMVAHDWGLDMRYQSVWAAGLPFAIGSCISWYRVQLKVVPNHFIAVLAICGILNWIYGVTTPEAMQMYFYLNLVFLPFIIVGCLRWLPPLSTIGGMAYPIFLCHWHVGSLMWLLGLAPARSMTLALVSFPLVLLLSWLIYRYVDRPVEQFRKKFRLPVLARALPKAEA